MVRRVLQEPTLKVGTHTWRKTGYCIAIFGKANRDDLKSSARHSKKSRSAPVYEKDAAATLETHERHQTDGNMVRKWSNIKVESIRNQRKICTDSGSEHHEIQKLPHHFVHNILKVEENNPNRKDIRYLLARAATYVKGTAGDERFDKFTLGYSRERKSELREIFEVMYTERRRRETYAAHLAAAAEVPAAAESPAASTQPQRRAREDPEPEDEPATNRPRREGPNNLDEKDDLQHMTTKQKVEAFVDWKANKKERGPYTPQANQFFTKKINPVIRCLTNHFDGDINAFVAAYPNLSYSTFAKKVCNGNEGQPCPASTSNGNGVAV
jgi:hypothetical protein